MLKKMTLVFFLFIISFQNFAQQQESDTVKIQFSPVTITAMRYAENIFEIPMSITIINFDKVNPIIGYGLNEVLSSVPGVLAQSRYGNQDVRIVIRGFGARGAGDRSNAGTSRGIRVMTNGIPETEPDGRTAFDLIDLSLAKSMEIIRSNASAIWGNASGGILNVSLIPTTDNPFTNVQSLFGSYGLNKYTFEAGTTFNESKIFGSFSQTYFDGWRENSRSKRGIINFGINSALSNKSNLGVYLAATENLFHIPGPLSQKQFDSSITMANPTYKMRSERRFNRLGRMGLTFDYNFDESNSISSMVFVNPKFLQRSERNTFRDFTRYHVGGNFLYKNLMNITSNLENKFLFGIDQAYQDGAILFYSLTPTGGRGTTLRTNKREGANTFGSFVQNELILNNQITFLAGARYDNITYSNESFMAPIVKLQSKSFTKITPKFGFTYRFAERHMLFLNFGGGVEVPAGNETDPANTFGQDTVFALNPLLEPITSTTLELGTKHAINFDNLFLHAVNYELSLYSISVKNDIIPYQGGRFYFTAGETSRIGAEFGATLMFDEGLTLRTAVTYSNNRYEDYKVDSVHYDKTKINRFADYSENKVAGIPDLFYNLELKYTPTFFNHLFIQMSLSGVGEYFVDDANTITVPNYNILSFSFGTNKEIYLTEKIYVKGFFGLNNIFDKKYAASAFINPDFVGGAPVFLEPGMPRNFVISFSLGWN
ncbi:MAG: hypothetical protein C0425_05280 [Chlorobiaceae bacterium]|nr:hypothetical protein [Chlorobiaceae bacterium]MBA4309729.1 hypothetical protein [Chlorobiaceae bacterium]